MKPARFKLLAAIVGLAVAGIVVAAGLATGPIGSRTVENLTDPPSRLADAWQVNTDRIKFQTKDAAKIVFQRVTYGAATATSPAADSGWHLHPGLVIVSVQSGEITRWVGCTTHVYRAGESFLESGEQPAGRIVNTGTTDAVLLAAFVVPDGSPLSDPSVPAPDCG